MSPTVNTRLIPIKKLGPYRSPPAKTFMPKSCPRARMETTLVSAEHVSFETGALLTFLSEYNKKIRIASLPYNRKREEPIESPVPFRSRECHAYNGRRRRSRDLMPPPIPRLQAAVPPNTSSIVTAHAFHHAPEHCGGGHISPTFIEAAPGNEYLDWHPGESHNLPSSRTLQSGLTSPRPSESLAPDISVCRRGHQAPLLGIDIPMHDSRHNAEVLTPALSRYDMSSQPILHEDFRKPVLSTASPAAFQGDSAATSGCILHGAGGLERGMQHRDMEFPPNRSLPGPRYIAASSAHLQSPSNSLSSRRPHQTSATSVTRSIFTGTLNSARLPGPSSDFGRLGSPARTVRSITRYRKSSQRSAQISPLKYGVRDIATSTPDPVRSPQRIFHNQTAFQKPGLNVKGTNAYSQQSIPTAFAVAHGSSAQLEAEQLGSSLCRIGESHSRRPGRISLATPSVSRQSISHGIKNQAFSHFRGVQSAYCPPSSRTGQDTTVKEVPRQSFSSAGRRSIHR
nr:hypothetical protein CFP56_72489 [Quercus suber]